MGPISLDLRFFNVRNIILEEQSWNNRAQHEFLCEPTYPRRATKLPPESLTLAVVHVWNTAPIKQVAFSLTWKHASSGSPGYH